MNLHAIVSPYVAAVSPFITVVVEASTGFGKGRDYSQVPTYAPGVPVEAQVQSLTYNDIAQLDGVNIQGERRAIYCNGDYEAVIRADQRGGDLVTFPDATVWLVAMVLERWPTGWVKLALTRQVATS